MIFCSLIPMWFENEITIFTCKIDFGSNQWQIMGIDIQRLNKKNCILLQPVYLPILSNLRNYSPEHVLKTNFDHL